MVICSPEVLDHLFWIVHTERAGEFLHSKFGLSVSLIQSLSMCILMLASVHVSQGSWDFLSVNTGILSVAPL